MHAACYYQVQLTCDNAKGDEQGGAFAQASCLHALSQPAQYGGPSRQHHHGQSHKGHPGSGP